ncbi:hypothetical protein WJU16_18750 [Chitinophaga pollutisoli]|uniref:Lipoprotein n=1 Tax=Chitinophaga pollutisoli TaxID=3133966 RepID=A0ABZ2YJW2_9BACT
MMKKLVSTFISLFFFSCRFIGDVAFEMKEQCIDEKLIDQKHSLGIIKIKKSFEDTFQIWRKDFEIFGSDKYMEHYVDDIVFLNRDSSKCILLVLKRAREGQISHVFGTARVIKGMMNNGIWNFFASQEFLYERDFFKKYQNNSFGTISKLARYSVLKIGNPPKLGCEIDESYWFK